jgi:pimeloyl-ACP methyl ester carboxylesterase
MFVRESGCVDSPSIVFLHGNGTSGDMWKAHVGALSEYHCLAPDLPGYGMSNQQQWVSLEETADEVIEIIHSHTQSAKAHIVGLSLGGSVALVLLSRAPDLVDHAIIDGAGVLPLPGLPFIKVGFHLLQPFLHTGFVIRTLAQAMKIPEADYHDFKNGMLAMSRPSFTRSFIQALSLRQSPKLEHVTPPVLFVAGEAEPQAVKQSNVTLANTMPNAQCRVAPNMSHAWLAEAPDLHIRMVRAWLCDQPLPL